ncbi:MAG TPA: hypothetical protein VGB95_06615, partial [Chitinophagales bacterium]
SVLVVRLKTRQKQIEAYKNAGDLKVANKMQEKVLIENLRIVSACIKYFSFAKIYFVNTEDVEVFQQTDQLKLSSFLPLKDSEVYLNHDSVFYLDYGVLYDRQAAGNQWSFKDYGETQEGSQTVSENAFVIRDSKNQQLIAPMPFYSVAMFSGGKKSKQVANPVEPYLQLNSVNSNSIIKEDLRKINFIDAAIIDLNGHLIEFYNRVTNGEHYNINYWYKNNPNAELYPKWVDVAKKLESLQKQNPQFQSQ